MDVTTGKGAEESGERRGAEAAVVVGGKASGRQRGERKESSVGGSRYREGGTEKNQSIYRQIHSLNRYFLCRYYLMNMPNIL